MSSDASAITKALFHSAAYLDIETLGLKRSESNWDYSPHQMSVYNAATGTATEFIPDPFRLNKIKGQDSDPLRARYSGSTPISDWQRAVLEKGKQPGSAWLKTQLAKRVNGEALYPHLTGGLIATSRTATVGNRSVGVNVRTGMDPARAYKGMLDAMGPNQVLWIANAQFEARELGAIGSVFGVTEQLRSRFTHAPKEAHELLYVNDPRVTKARAAAMSTGDWRPVWEAIASTDLSEPGIKTFDIQDVIKGAQSYASEVSSTLGLKIHLGDPSTGVALDVQSRIMGLGSEYHRAAEDNLLASIIGENTSEHISAYKGILDRAQSATGAALTVTSAKEADALNWAHKLQSFKQGSASEYMKYNVIARAMKDFEFGDKVYGRDHTFTTGFDEAQVPQVNNGKPSWGTVAVPRRESFANMDELLGFVSQTRRGQGLDLKALEAQVRAEATAGGGLDIGRLNRMIESGSSRAIQSHLAVAEALPNRFSVGDVLRSASTPLINRASKLNGKYIMGGAAIVLGIGAISGMSSGASQSSTNVYNPIEGMSEGTYASWLRHQNTDFGSGYRNVVGGILAASVIGGLSSFNMSLNQGIHTPTSKSLISVTSNQVRQAGKNDIIFAAEEYYNHPSKQYGGFTFKEAAERIGARVIPVGTNNSLEDAIKIANSDMNRSRVFIAAHGNNGTIVKFTGTGAAVHDWVGTSPGYLAKNLDKRFTIDLGVCNAKYLLNSNEADIQKIEQNRTKLGSNKPLQIYSDVASADEMSRVRAYSGGIDSVSGKSYVAPGFESYFLEKANKESFSSTPALRSGETVAYTSDLMGKGISHNRLTGTTADLFYNTLGNEYGNVLQPSEITRTFTKESTDVDFNIRNFKSKTLGHGLTGAIGGFITGLFKSVGSSLSKLNLSKKIKSLAEIPSVASKKTLNAMNAGLNSAGVTGRAILGSVIKTGQNLGGFATSTGRSIKNTLDSRVGKMSEFATKAIDSVSSNTKQAYKSLKNASLNVRTSIGRNSNDLLRRASSNEKLPTSTPSIGKLPKSKLGAVEHSKKASVSRSYRSDFGATRNGPAKIDVGPGNKIPQFSSSNSYKTLQTPSRAGKSIGISRLSLPHKVKLHPMQSAVERAADQGPAYQPEVNTRRIDQPGRDPGMGVKATRAINPVSSVESKPRDFNKFEDALWDDNLDKPWKSSKSNRPISPVSSSNSSQVPPEKLPTSSPKKTSSTESIKTGKAPPSPTTKATPVVPEIIDDAVEMAPKPAMKGKEGLSTHTPKGKMGYGLAIGLAAATVIGIAGMSAFSGKGSDSNSIEGMSSRGSASQSRERNTDFGSPYGGLWGSASLQILNGGMQSTPNYVNNIPIDQQISDFRDQQMQTPFQKKLIEQQLTKQTLQSMDRLYFLNPALTTPLASQNYSVINTQTTALGDLGTDALIKSKNLQVMDLNDVNWAVEDADTIIMKQGVRGLLGQESQVRLAGIDAPEIQHEGEGIESLRYKQSQPHGEESRDALRAILKDAKDIKLVIDPKADTYGRSLGVIIADGKNVNLEMIRRGHAAALPFGESTSDIVDRNVAMSYEKLAYENNKGMWSDNYWRTYRQTVSQENRITFNTLSRIDKLAGNMNIAALESTMSLSQDPGQSQLVNKSIPFLRKKLSNFGKKKKFTEYIVPVKYQAKQEHLDQLKVETSRHMRVSGNLLSEERMNSRSHQFGNMGFAVDSLERSSSIYHSKLPGIIDKYDKKTAKRRVQGAVQRQANRDAMSDQNIVRI